MAYSRQVVCQGGKLQAQQRLKQIPADSWSSGKLIINIAAPTMHLILLRHLVGKEVLRVRLERNKPTPEHSLTLSALREKSSIAAKASGIALQRKHMVINLTIPPYLD